MNSNIYHTDIKALAAASLCCEPLDNADASVTLDNPLCGDRVTVAVKLENTTIVALAQEVKGCLLCKAAANAIAQAALGCSITALKSIASQLEDRLTSPAASSSWPPAHWPALSLFDPVAKHKSRHQCVLLPFKATLQACTEASLLKSG